MSNKLEASIQQILKRTAIKLLRDGKDLNYIAAVTNFSLDQLLIIKNKL